MAQFLPFHVPDIGREDIDAVVEALESGWLTTGPKAEEFENRFKAAVNAPYAVALNSGTAALHLALHALGLQPGDEVILPALTFAATAEVVCYFGARPVLVDSNPHDGNLNPAAVERAITPRTRVLLPVHYAGQPCDMDAILHLARAHRLAVVEDAAHAFPAAHRGCPVGSLGDVTCFSFYATKTITTGEGGMATTAKADLAERMRRASIHGISRDAWARNAKGAGAWRYEILEPGFKYNLPDMAAALGLAQLAKAERLWHRRCQIAQRYQRNLGDMHALELPAEAPNTAHAWHLYVLRLRPHVLTIGRDQLIDELADRGIGTSVHFIPLHLHRYYQDVWGYSPGDFPMAENFFDRCLSLPIYPGLTDADVDRVSQGLVDIAERFTRAPSHAIVSR